ncbi:hypothetical protein AXA44_45425 [Rhodococcus sp. SC4]|nr:hypothetical protein AXA44_45425 [Rhodococcus sp. SC4]
MYSAINYEDMSTAAPYDNRTVREYCDVHFNTEVRENLIAPLTRALLLVEPERTSVVDLFAAMKSLLVADHLLTNPNGVAAFLQRAVEGIDVRCNTSILHVTESDGSVDVVVDGATDEPTRFDGCVVALPARNTLEVLPHLDERRRTYLKDLEYSTCIVVNLGISRAPDENASMVLIPRHDDTGLAAVGLGHNLAPGRVPPGGGILTAYWMTKWSQDHWSCEDDELVSLTSATIERLFPGWVTDIEAAHVTRWDPAVVASRPGTFRDLVGFSDQADPQSRVVLAGDYMAQTSVNASVAAGELAATRLARVLTSNYL